MHPINEQCFRYFAQIIRTLKGTHQFEHVLSLIVDRMSAPPGVRPARSF